MNSLSWALYVTDLFYGLSTLCGVVVFISIGLTLVSGIAIVGFNESNLDTGRYLGERDKIFLESDKRKIYFGNALKLLKMKQPAG